jgi:uncharacterized membrane protein YhaH (DUF805 family)
VYYAAVSEIDLTSLECESGKVSSLQPKFSNFMLARGKVGRSLYAASGILLFLVKHNLDRVIAHSLGYDWSILDYWIFDRPGLLDLNRHRAELYAILIILALPFIWIGVVLTIRRLRDAGLPTLLVLLFFVPLVNAIFFLVLSLVPSKLEGGRTLSSQASWRDWFARLIPRSEFGSAAFGILITSLLAILFALLSIYVIGQYGWGIFIGIPFFLGLNSVLIYGYHEPRPFLKCFLVSFLSVALVAIIIFLIAVEGAICIMMAAPLAGTLAILGGLIGYFLQCRRPAAATPISAALVLFLPTFISFEPLIFREPPRYEVRTAVIINADRQSVWRNVVTFPELPPPHELVFKTGVAFPIRAEIDGRGLGSTRHCVFSTGEFVEPITVWDEPNLLRFRVETQPRAMDELSLYRNIHPPHVSDYLVSRQGQFLLTTMPDGRTLLEGTTVYEIHFWPGSYWRVWSDFIIHRIHYRVLDHIKKLSEQ